MTFPWIFSVRFGVLKKINPITGYIENNNKKQIPFSGFAASCACAKRQNAVFSVSFHRSQLRKIGFGGKKVRWTFFPSNPPTKPTTPEDNGGRWGARRPGGVGFAPTGAKRRLNPLGSIYASVWNQKRTGSFEPILFVSNAEEGT